MPLTPQVVSGQAIGTVIAVANSADLANLTTQGLSLGTKVYNIGVGNYFSLKRSEEALVPDQVVEVSGVSDQRWVVDQGSAAPWLTHDTQFYASPSGSPSNDGTSWQTPKADIYTALEAAISVGGGTVNYVAGTPAGGPIPSQGIWLRQDYNSVPGFLNIESIPITIVGWQSTQPGPFQQPGPAQFTGPDNSGVRTKPAVWVVGGAAASGWELNGIATPNFLDCPFRTWDYHRNFDGTIQAITITSSTRSSGLTTHTLTLPGPVTVIKAGRTSGTVTLRLRWPMGYQYAPGQLFLPQAWGRVSSTDVRFPALDTLVTSLNAAAFVGDNLIDVTYAQAGADVAFSDVSGVGFTSHCIAPNNRIELFSSSSEFPTTQYKVTSATVDTITVTDIYGYSPRSASITASNIGSLAKQEREGTVLNNQIVANCRFIPNNGIGGTDVFAAGPTMDVSAHTAFPLRIYDSFIGGYVFGTGIDPNTDPRVDQDRWSGILQDSHSPQNGVSVYNGLGSGAGLRIYNYSENGRCTVDDYLVDSGNGLGLPTVELKGPNSGGFDLIARRVISADSNAPAIRADPTSSPFTIRVVDPGIGDSGPFTYMSKFYQAEPAPWVNRQHGIWQRGLSANWAGLSRAYGVYQAQLPNQIPANWASGLPAAAAPDGSGNTAATPSAGSETSIWAMPLSPGDVIGMGVMVNCSSAANALGINGIAPMVAVIESGGGTWDITGTNVTAAMNLHWAPGWQWVTISARLVASGSCVVDFRIRAGTTGTTTLWMPTLFVATSATATDEAYEIIGTMRQHPPYLLPGSAGTSPGIKLIGHGGLGTAKKYTAGAGSGQITVGSSNGKYVELFDESGNSLGVFGPGNAFTVNP